MYEYETMRVVLGHRAAPLVIGHGYAVRTREQYQSCVISLLAGTGAMLSETVVEWIYGFFSEVGQRIGGPWLHVCIQAPAAMSNVGLSEAEMSSDSGGLITVGRVEIESILAFVRCVGFKVSKLFTSVLSKPIVPCFIITKIFLQRDREKEDYVFYRASSDTISRALLQTAGGFSSS
jgi:hypothetical protein